jgi:arsenite-transporting ATPase
VGKTTCAASAALAAVDAGRRILLISTDPAHSLGDALGRPLGARPRRVPTRRGELQAVELDADRALDRWLAGRRRHLRTILGRGTYLDEEDIDRFLRLSLPGVDELMGLIELTRLARAHPDADVVVDTAPTGHTLRLLHMPATLERIAVVLDDMQAKHRVLARSLGGGHHPDEADALIEGLAGESRDLHDLLRDPERCAFTWVLLAEALSLEEARDGIAALQAAGIPVAEIVVNRLTPRPAQPCALCDGRQRAEQAVLTEANAAFSGRPLRWLPDVGTEPRGVASLLRLGRVRNSSLAPGARRGRPGPRPQPAPDGAAWLDHLAPAGVRLLLFVGKGGVGKTSCAAAVALALAERPAGGKILLLSTDPAPSLADALAVPVGDEARPIPGVRRLHVRELDADRALAARRARYRDAVDELFTALRGDSRFELAFDRAVVQDLIDLAPPGLDELFGILTVIEALFPASPGAPAYDTVVLDTAPTGHTLRLLELPAAALEWAHALLAILLKYRKVIGLGGELGEDLVALSRDLKRLLALLGDPSASRLVAVTRAAELPGLETRRLLRAVRRLAIPVGAVIVNALTPRGCARCRRAAAAERRALAALRRELRSPARRRCAIIVTPAVAPPPRGRDPLVHWRAGWELDREQD